MDSFNYFLNWAILLFPVGSLWKIHAGFQCEAAEQGWAWRAINHRRYIIHWKHVKRTRQDGPDHWKQHFHRSVHEEDRWRCALPLGQFCYDHLTKTRSNIYWFRIFCTTQKWNVGALFLAPGGSRPGTRQSLTCREHYYSIIQSTTANRFSVSLEDISPSNKETHRGIKMVTLSWN